MVRNEIADNGPGISDEEKQRLFDMFYTVNRGGAGADSRRGLGIGAEPVQIDCGSTRRFHFGI